MSSVAYQGGEHDASAHTSGNGASGNGASGNWDEFSEFPRFLGRDGADHMANLPPPLPRVAWYVHVQWMLRRTSPRRLAALASAFVVLVPAATALVLDKDPAQIPLQINVIQVKSIDHTPEQIPGNLQTAAELEARLEYGVNLATAVRETQPASSTSDQYAEATLPKADPAEPPDTPALLILRNLPENVTFTSGERSGKSEWVMAAGDPNQLDMTLGEGFEQPVAADVELVSHAGLTLGLLHLELRRNVAAVAEVESGDTPQEPDAPADTGITAQKAEAKVGATETEVKPRKRARRAATRKNSKFARAEGGYIKRAKKSDRWKTETVESTDGAANQSSAEAETQAPVDETAKGPISKFFSWIAGGGTSTAPEDATDATKATLFPQ